MAEYLLTITPVGDRTHAHGQATIRVETAPVPRITEITVTATAFDELSAATLPSIDLEGVMRALTAGVRPSPAPEPVPAAGEPPAAEAPAPRPAPTARTTRRKSDRPYRQMPDPTELKSVYDEVGTVTGVAARYNVPRHTAQGWISRLRRSAR